MRDVYRATDLLTLGLWLAGSPLPPQQQEVLALASTHGIEHHHNLFSSLAHLLRAKVAAGEAALRKDLMCLRKRALDIPDEAAHQRFLLQVPENARTLELARQRWGEVEIRETPPHGYHSPECGQPYQLLLSTRS